MTHKTVSRRFCLYLERWSPIHVGHDHEARSCVFGEVLFEEDVLALLLQTGEEVLLGPAQHLDSRVHIFAQHAAHNTTHLVSHVDIAMAMTDDRDVVPVSVTCSV
jgi:hypothetical protein